LKRGQKSKAAKPLPYPSQPLPWSAVLPLALALLLLLPALLTGCGIVQSAADIPGQTVRAVNPGSTPKETNVIDPESLQQNLARFGDQFLTHMIVSLDLLQRTSAVADPADIVRWKIAFCTKVTAVVSGPNAVANLLDMTVLVTVTRISLEEHWKPDIFGDAVGPMVDIAKTDETEIWKMTDGVLKPEQKTQLRDSIQAWLKENPIPGSILAARAVGFASEMKKSKGADDGNKPGSVFAMLNLDPLAGLDPAAREIAKSRLFAERVLYVMQKTPMLFRWHVELLSLNTADQPAVRQLVTNSTQIAASVERFASTAEKLPELVSSEREQIIKALEAQEKTLTPLVGEVRQVINSGTQMSDSVNTTLATFNSLMKLFGLSETNAAPTGPPATNSEPFRIQDYTETAVRVEGAAKQITELLVTVDRTIGSTNLMQLAAQAGPVLQQAQTGGKQIVDYAFIRAILLVVIVLAAALIYRVVAVRLAAKPRPGDPR
jgi:hypothetical protein